MAYLFGKDEKLTCIVDVALKGQNDEPLCLAYKTMSYSIFAPLYFKDEGYVLAVKSGLSKYYPMPSGAELTAMQAASALPNPLPPYTIPFHRYAFGYLLWIVLALLVVFYALKARLKERRKRSLETRVPPGSSPLVIRTKTDQFLADEAKKFVEPGETVEQQAYGYDREETGVTTKALYLVLTNRRLAVIQSRLGAFGPLRENRGVTLLERSVIQRVEADERHLRFFQSDGSVFDFFAEWSEKHLSNQRRFLADVPRLLGSPIAAMPSLEPGRAST
jgi:hypothetical protein